MGVDDDRPKRTIEIPEGFTPAARDELPLAIWVGDGDERDPSKPIGYDADGRPLYAPPGIRLGGLA